jgi:hypothetical protein
VLENEFLDLLELRMVEAGVVGKLFEHEHQVVELGHVDQRLLRLGRALFVRLHLLSQI